MHRARVKLVLAVVAGLVIATTDASGQGQNYDLSSMPPDQRVPLTFDNNGISWGIYANKVKNRIVTTDGGFVGPAGAGIFFASPEKRYGGSGIPCVVLLRRDRITPSLAEVPISCRAKGVWFDATVTEGAKVLDDEGKSVHWGLAKPTSGALESIDVRSKSMTEDKTLTAGKDGSIAIGRLSLATLGDIEVLFTTGVGRANPYLIISPTQLRKLTSLLAPADSKELLRRISQ